MKAAEINANMLVDVIHTADATIALISLHQGSGAPMTWSGTAKRCPEDKFNVEVGTKLALGRALEAAGKQLIKQGNGLVKNIEDNRRDSARKRAAREKVETTTFPVARPRQQNQSDISRG